MRSANVDQRAKQNLIGKEGTIIDATIVEAPIQHNSKEENEQIKQGEIPQGWQGEKHKAKLYQKDRDARWTKKHNRSYFGYKDHVKTDVKSKFILKATVTAAHVLGKGRNLLSEKSVFPSLINFKLTHLLRQALNTPFILLRNLAHFLYRIVNLHRACNRSGELGKIFHIE